MMKFLPMLTLSSKTMMVICSSFTLYNINSTTFGLTSRLINHPMLQKITLVSHVAPSGSIIFKAGETFQIEVNPSPSGTIVKQRSIHSKLWRTSISGTLFAKLLLIVTQVGDSI